MKERADVVVIGAGIVGCAAAHYLTLAGVRDVVVVDQGPIGDTGGSSFHAPGLCFQTNGSKLSCTLAQWTRELYRSLDTPERRTWWEVGSLEVATTPERLAEMRRRHAYATSWGLESHVITPDEAIRHIPLLDRELLHGALHVPSDGIARGHRTSARRCRRRAEARGATFVGRTRATGIDMARRQGAGGRDRPGRDPHVDGTRLPGPLGAGVHARARPAAGGDAADAAPLRLDRAAARAGRREPASITRSCAIRIAPCTSASAARATASAPTGTTPITIEPAELERHPDGHQIATGPFSRGALARVARLGARAAAPARKGRHRRDVQRALLVRGRQQLVRRARRRRSAGLWLADGIWVTHAGGTAKAVVDLMTTGRCELDLGPMHPDRLHQFQRSPLYVKARGRTQYDEVYDIIHPGQVLAHPRGVRTTPWHERFLDHGAELTESAGWERGQWFRANDALPLPDVMPERSTWAQRHWSPTIGREHLATRTGVGRVRPDAVRQGRGRGAGRHRVAQPRLRERDGPSRRPRPLHDGARPRRRLRLRPHRHAAGRRALPARDGRRLGPARRRLAAQRAARGRLRAPARRLVVARRARALGPALGRGAGAAEPRRSLVPVPERARDLGRRGARAGAAHLLRGRARAGSSTRRPSTGAISGISSSRPAPTRASWPAARARSTPCAWRRATASRGST